MDLWSKGLGKLVLSLHLRERSEMCSEGDELVMRGTMGAPTYWNWAVNLTPEDVLDFLVFLKQPAPVRYMVETGERWRILRTALGGAVLFLMRTLGYFLSGGPRSASVPAPMPSAPIDEIADDPANYQTADPANDREQSESEEGER